MFVILGCRSAQPSRNQFIARPPYWVVDTTDLVVESAGIDDILALHRMGELVANLSVMSSQRLEDYVREYNALPLTDVTYESILANRQGACKLPYSLRFAYWADNQVRWSLQGAFFRLETYTRGVSPFFIVIECNGRPLITYKYVIGDTGVLPPELRLQTFPSIGVFAVYRIEEFLEIDFTLNAYNQDMQLIHLLTFRLLFDTRLRSLIGGYWGKTIGWTPDDDERNWGYLADTGELECHKQLSGIIIKRLRRFSVRCL